MKSFFYFLVLIVVIEVAVVWLAGYNFDTRGFNEAYTAVVCLVIAVWGASFLSTIFDKD